MADLQCAATLYVARHAEAEYESALLSDCGGSLTPRGREQARALGVSLRDARIAVVHTSPMARAVQTAEIAAAVLGVGVQVREGLREFSVGKHHGKAYDAALFDPTFTRWLAGDLAATVPGGESGAEVVGRMREEIELMADLYRGESVLVVSHGGAMCAALPQLSRNLPGDYPAGRPLRNCDVVEAAVDADGLVVLAWAGERSAGWA